MRGLSGCDELVRVHTGKASESTAMLIRVARPLACSVAIHLGLGTLVVAAGSAGLAAAHAPRTVWLDLTPADVPAPAAPTPPAVAPRPRPAPAPAVALRKPPPVLDEPVAPPAPPSSAPVPTPPAAVA